MRDLLEALVEHGMSRGADYTEVRHQQRLRSLAIVRTGEMDTASSGVGEGCGIRALVDGSWGFSTTSSLNRKELLRKVEEAVRLASSSAPIKATKVKLADVKPVQGEARAEMKDDLRSHSLEEKIALAIEADKYAKEYSEEIRSRIVRYDEHIVEKHYVNSDGSYYYLFDVKPQLVVEITAKRGDAITETVEGTCKTMGWELFKEEDPIKTTERACKRAVNLLDAKRPASGVKTVVLDPTLVGILSHEAIGHTVEADFVIAGSAASGKIDEKVASEIVTLVDDGTIATSAGWLPFDDEGVLGKKTIIIDNGILRSYLHNRETALKFNVEPTGNSRAWSYRDIPLIRMRATYIESRDWERQQIIEDTKDGLLLMGAQGGQTDSNAEFMFGIQEAYKIERGEIKEPYRGVTISGNAYNVLSSVDAVGKDFDLNIGWGYCGKVQRAKVDGGGPSVRSTVLIGGQ